MNLDVEKTVKQYLSAQQLIDFDDGSVNNGTDLFGAGLMDSFTYIELIKHLEDEFRVKFSPEEILDDVVVSVDGLAQLIRSKLRARA